MGVNGLLYHAIAGLDLRPANEISQLRLLAREPHLAYSICGSLYENRNLLVAFAVLVLRPANDIIAIVGLMLRTAFRSL